MVQTKPDIEVTLGDKFVYNLLFCLGSGYIVKITTFENLYLRIMQTKPTKICLCRLFLNIMYWNTCKLTLCVNAQSGLLGSRKEVEEEQLNRAIYKLLF